MVRIGSLRIGGSNPVLVQSMATVRTGDVRRVSAQINDLAARGCGLVRVSVLNRDDAAAIQKIKERITIPVCADIHFSDELALAAITAGADKIRINPGNIGGAAKVRRVIRAAKKKSIAVRVGVNSGSLEAGIYSLAKRSQAMVRSLRKVVAVCEDEGFTNLVLSIKSSNPVETIETNRLLAVKTRYPIHLGVTATGAGLDAVIKSTAALGTLLAEGIGDTIRVSLTADPVEEVVVANKILQALGLKEYPYEVIACPTCGRTEIDIVRLAREIENRMAKEYPQGGCRYRKIAVMGCIVNGPGEAQDADIGIAGGRGFGFIFKKGKRGQKIAEDKLVDALFDEMKK